MSFERPSLHDIIRRVTSDFEYELGSQAPRLPGTPEYAFVRSGAGVAHGMHGRIDRVRRDAFWATSSDEELIRKASMFGVFHLPAFRSTGILGVSADIGYVVAAGTLFQRADGVTYEVTTSTEAFGGTALAPARAVVSGAAGNMEPTVTQLTLQSPNASIFGATAEVGGAEWANGSNAESTASLRRRLAQRLASPPKGGGPGDYIRWALGGSDPDKVPEGAVPPGGITRAWEYGRVPKIGNVTVLVMRDDDDDPFPSDAELLLVKEWILLFAPIAMPEVIVLAPIPKVLDIEIALIIEDDADLVVVRAAIEQALADMVTARAEPPKDGSSVFYKSWITQVISNTPGEKDNKVTQPVGDVALAQWDLVTLGTITWT